MFLKKRNNEMPTAERALPGRDEAIPVPSGHFLYPDRPIAPPFPAHLEVGVIGMGCFWGAERKFWQVEGVYTTAVGYAGGLTKNPSYKEVCTGMTGHNEVVLFAFDPTVVTYAELLQVFFENHDPTQGMRQGNDVGTQYRSGIYPSSDAQREVAERVKRDYAAALKAAGHARAVTTEIIDAPTFFYAEEYHQQYLAKNPQGYCGIGGTGVSCPVGVAT